MNRSSARLTRTFLALTVLGLGVAGCTDTTKTAPTAGSPSTTTSTTKAPPAASPSPLPEPEAAAPNAVTAPQAVTAPRSATRSKAVTAPANLGVTKAQPRTPTTICSTEKKWGSRPLFGSSSMSPAPLYLTRVGRHDCFDRVVFDINGPHAVGFVARYVPVVSADGSGTPVPVAGRAALQVIVRAPIFGTDSQGHQPWRSSPRFGESLITPASISGWPSLRAVRFAGSFEGQTTVAVGVRERLPFRAFVTREGSVQHVVLDVSH